MKRTAVSLALAALLLSAASHAADRLTVVELFTSQGCSSCPPADERLAHLAKQDDVLALSWAVDYWDYLGWKDIFGSPRHTKRQYSYNDDLGRRNVYTPQMVFDGRFQAVGSRALSVRDALARARTADRMDMPLVIDQQGKVMLGDGVAAGRYTVRAVWYSAQERVEIRRGENRGRGLIYTNIVLGDRDLGHWAGKAKHFSLPMDKARRAGASHIAVLVQQNDTGPIVGATYAKLDDLTTIAAIGD